MGIEKVGKSLLRSGLGFGSGDIIYAILRAEAGTTVLKDGICTADVAGTVSRDGRGCSNACARKLASRQWIHRLYESEDVHFYTLRNHSLEVGNRWLETRTRNEHVALITLGRQQS